MYLEGFLSVLTNPLIWIAMFFGVVLGIIFGAIPGLSATMAITMCLPLTYSMDTSMAIAVLISLYVGGISGGLISAILLNIPGTPSSVATTFDGAPMASNGQAYRALGIGVCYSFMGTIFGLCILLMVAPQLASLAIQFGPFEYCALAVLSLSIVVALAGKDFLKGLISAALGLMFATVGLSPLDGSQRFTFDNLNLTAGIELLTILIGLFAIKEVINAAIESKHPVKMEIREIHTSKGLGFSLKEFKSNLPNFVTSSAIGTGIGILPGIGGGVAGMLAYTLQKTRSKNPEKFGTGCMEGIVAAESSNNAVIGGALVPLLTLGIPGDGATAMLLGGLMIHSVTPGPLIFDKYGDVVYALYAALFLSTIFMFFAEWLGMKYFVKVLKIPRNLLLPCVVVMCSIGAFGSNNRSFSVLMVMVFGLIGYLMSKGGLPATPLILAFILGSTLETNLRRASQLLAIDSSELFAHPIANTLIIMAVIFVSAVLYSRRKKPNAT